MARKSNFFVIASALLMWVLFPVIGYGQSSSPPGAKLGPAQGICVYYNDKFHGHTLASGEKYDKEALTAAHKTLPFGTMVKVTNLENNKSTVVRVNDRGPHGSKMKIIEITSRAAKEIDMVKKGKVKVAIEAVESPKK